MIDPNKCQTCYPVVAHIFEMKFEGDKAAKQCVMRAWVECSQPAIQHVTGYVDPNRPDTMFVLHRCADHSKALPEPQVKVEIIGDCFE
jgi:hypothetical protein